MILTGETEVLGGRPVQRYSVHYKSHMAWNSGVHREKPATKPYVTWHGPNTYE